MINVTLNGDMFPYLKEIDKLRKLYVSLGFQISIYHLEHGINACMIIESS